MDDNFERLKDKRTEVAKWRREYEVYKQQIGKYKKFKVGKKYQLAGMESDLPV